MAKEVRVLLIDDDPQIRKQVRYFFKNLPYTLAGVASSGKAGIRQVKKVKPDVILMDVIMETTHAGIDAAIQIKKKADIPIIFLTVSHEEETMIKALQTEPYGYLHKPVQPELLKSAIEISLLRRRYEQKLKKYQKALEESEALFRGIFSKMPNGFYRIDGDDKILMVNPTMVNMLGYTSEQDLINKNIYELGFVAQETRQKFRDNISRKGRVSLLESEWITRKGSVINVIENAQAIHDKNGKLLFYEGIVQDITQLKELEKQLRHSQKMEVIGILGSRIAHEINNLLTSILGYAELSLLKTDKNNKLYKYLKAIQNNARNATGVIQNLLKFSRRQASRPKEFNLNTLITSMHEIIHHTLGRNIDLKIKLISGNTKIFADPKLIEQVIMNLILNARDAMPEGGELNIKTARRKITDKFKHKPQIPDGSYITMTISDTGHGIIPEIKQKIFDPFFTTKGESIGTGLGLSIVLGIVKETNGFISVTSEKGKGASFQIIFPAVK